MKNILAHSITNVKNANTTAKTKKKEGNPKMNFHKKVEKHMYMDGFHKGKNHTLWKLKKQLTPQQWEKVKQYFNCYNHTDKECSNVKYFGWATTEPVKVMLTLEQGE